MTKQINVILNSKSKTSGTTNEATYFINWKSILDPKKKYFLHWTYLGGSNTYTGTKLALVYLNFNSNTFTNNTQTLQCIGFLKPIVLVGASNTVYLQAEDNTNLPVYLNSMPMNNNLVVSIYDNSGTLWKDNAATPVVPTDYILTLKFTEVDEE